MRVFSHLNQHFPIRKGTRNKSFKIPTVLNHQESDGDRDFSVGPRHLVCRDHFWGHFCIIFNENFENSILHSSDRFKTQRNQVLLIRIIPGSPRELPFFISKIFKIFEIFDFVIDTFMVIVRIRFTFSDVKCIGFYRQRRRRVLRTPFSR